jgi:energy-coupling factor transporter ATP-binding protein EcfA2
VFLKRVRLTNVRSRHELEVELSEGLNVLIGPNGAGKTTVLEAAALVLTGAAIRSGNARDLISRDRDHLRVEVELSDPAGETSQRPIGTTSAAAAYSRDGERRLTADGAPLDDAVRWTELLPVRTFAPDDLRLIKGSPRRRREYLDSLASRSYPEYPGALRRYEEALSQRNFLLRASRGGSRGGVRAVGAPCSRRRVDRLPGSVRGGPRRSCRRSRELTRSRPGNPRRTYGWSIRTNVADLDEAGYRARLVEMRAPICSAPTRTWAHIETTSDCSAAVST